jgi:hypothetical protein
VEGGVLLFGGYGSASGADAYAYLNDTWLWSGAGWTRYEPQNRPSPRYWPAMATLKGKVVLFGGWSASERELDDTWEWDGQNWTRRETAQAPAGRDGAAFANVGGDRLVYFGGGEDTWQWDGQSWTELNPDPAPGYRKYLHAGSLSGRVILFSGATGQSPSDVFFSDTWNWNGSSWSRLFENGPPAGRRDFGMYSTGGGILMFGGFGQGGQMFGDSWEFRDNGWVSRVGGGPSARSGAFIAAR